MQNQKLGKHRQDGNRQRHTLYEDLQRKEGWTQEAHIYCTRSEKEKQHNTVNNKHKDQEKRFP